MLAFCFFACRIFQTNSRENLPGRNRQIAASLLSSGPT
ncbi:hypothetical protein RNAN_3287 [Rheinheimera nanhaiensis E407-8]|uniref:Uncharacterized protein n=1 Tax=Rheinheimera nanhaiensis E407-8 TaxID=562729 RepID=I1E1U0_9GAMM|nr:hypothetical protein RNAN_3287 [Rheinheimera nanhaiensis E407-8]